MSRSSKKWIAEISTSSTNDTFLDIDENNDRLALLERKIAFAIEGFTTQKFCELVLTDRSRERVKTVAALLLDLEPHLRHLKSQLRLNMA